MKPEKKTTATMNTTPATMPTQAATAASRDRCAGSTTGGGVGAVATGAVAGSVDDVVSLMASSCRGF
jgi:hypothetical protein